MISKILVPTDGSTGATEAAAYAASLAQRLGARATLLHVVEMPKVPLSPTILAATPRIRQDLTQAGEAILAMTARAFGQAGVPVEMDLREGTASEMIGQVAAQGGYDLIVIGSRGRTETLGLLLGSVSEAVARSAPCPVLIVRRGTTTYAEGAVAVP